jgi:uncharacterized repeat protein (TIGR02543 family)
MALVKSDGAFNDGNTGTSESKLLRLSGKAAVLSDGSVSLAPGEAGGIFLNRPLSMDKGFSVMYKMHLGEIPRPHSTLAGDGFVFVLSATDNTIGNIGGAMGFSDIRNSIGVEYDTFCNIYQDEEYGYIHANEIGYVPHVAYGVDGILHNGDFHDNDSFNENDIVGTNSLGNKAFLFGSTDPADTLAGKENYDLYGWADYNPLTGVLEYRLSTTATRPGDPTITVPKAAIQQSGLANEFYIGFTAAVAMANQEMCLTEWYVAADFKSGGIDSSDTGNFEEDNKPPVPAASQKSIGGDDVILSATDDKSDVEKIQYFFGPAPTTAAGWLNAWKTAQTITGDSGEVVMPAGDDIIHVRAIDKAGNISDPVTRVWSMLTTTVESASYGSAVGGGRYFEGTEIPCVATPNPKYEFTGWTTEDGGSFDNPSKPDTIYTMPANAAVLKANFNKIYFDVTYDAGIAETGTVPTDDNLYHTGEKATVADNIGILAKPLHVFDGWESSADNKVYKPGDSIEVTSDIELTAQFKTNFYPVIKHFGTYEGSGTLSATIDCDDYKKMTRLLYDGKVVPEANYTVKSGSTIVTLSESYLNTFAVGSHDKFIAEFIDGKSEDIKLTVAESPSPGDGGNGNDGNNNPDNPGNSGDGDTADNGGNSGNEADKTSDINYPSTGDDFNEILYLVLIFVSVVTMVFVFRVRRQRNDISTMSSFDVIYPDACDEVAKAAPGEVPEPVADTVIRPVEPAETVEKVVSELKPLKSLQLNIKNHEELDNLLDWYQDRFSLSAFPA